MRTRIMIAVLGCVLIAASVLRAQDYIFAFRATGFVEIEIPSAPCPLLGSASMTVYDRSAWLVFTCIDQRVILRRYFNPNDNGIAPSPVYVVPQPGSVAQASAPTPVELPTVMSCAQYPGFVPTKGGTGCVPPNHPDAAGR